MRKIEDEAHARGRLAAVKAAGGASVAWANANGVDARSLKPWLINLSRRGAPKLVELSTAPRSAARPRAVVCHAQRRDGIDL
jgi:hypothetical protein